MDNLRAMSASSSGSMPDSAAPTGVKRSLCRPWVSKVIYTDLINKKITNHVLRATVTWGTAASSAMVTRTWLNLVQVGPRLSYALSSRPLGPVR